MTGPIDTAYVEFEAKTDRLDAGAGEAFSHIAELGTAVTEAIDAAFERMTTQIVDQFEMMRREADDNMDALVGSVDRVAVDIGERLDEATNVAQRGFDDLRRHADEDLDRVERKSSQVSSSVRTHFGNMSMGIVGPGLAIAGVGAAAAGLEQIAQFGLKSAASLEQTQIAFDQLTGSVAAGENQYKQLQQFAAATPFEFNDLVTGAKRFDAFSKTVGISQSQLIPFMTTIGNLVSETGGGAQALDTITLALGQTASQGKLTLGNLDQINNAIPGFSSVAALASVRGESTAQVMKEISSGSIDATTGIHQLLQGMNQFPGAAGAMEKQSQTLLGVWSTLHDTVSMQLSNAFQGVIPQIKKSLNDVTPIIGDAVNQIAPALGNLIAGALPLIGRLIAGITALLAPLLAALGPGLAAIAPAITPLANALAQVANAIAPILTLAGQLIGALGQGLAPIISALSPVLAGLTSGLLAALQPLIPIIVQLGGIIGAILMPVSVALARLFEDLGPIIGQLVGALGTMLQPLLTALAPLITKLVEALEPLFPAFLQMLPPLIQLTIALTPLIVLVAQLLTLAVDIAAPIIKLLAAFDGFVIVQLVVPMLTAMVNVISFLLRPVQLLADGIAGLVHWFGSIDWGAVGTAIVNGLGAALSWIGGIFSTAWNAVTSAVGTAVDAVVGFFEKLPGRIVAFLVALPGMLASLAQQAVDGFFFMIGYGIGKIIWAFTVLPGEIAALLLQLKNRAIQLIREMIDWIVNEWNAFPGQAAAIWNFVWNWISSRFSAGVQSVKNFLNALPGILSNAWNSAMNYARSAVSSGISAIMSFFSSLPGRVWNALVATKNAIIGVFSGASGWLWNAGVNVISGLIEGVKAAIGWAIGQVQRAMHNIVSGAEAALGIHSPSVVFAQLGKYSVQGYTLGMQQEMSRSTQAVSNALAPASNPNVVNQTSVGTMNGFSGTVVVNIGGRQVEGTIVDIMYNNAQDVAQAATQGNRQLARRQ